MRAITLMMFALAVACGRPQDFESLQDPAPLELGILEQPIFMPTAYGSEKGDQTRCDEDWSGGTCVIPDNRSPNFGIDQCGANTAMFHSNIYTALGYVIGVTNSVPLEWATTRSHSNGGDFIFRCVGDAEGSPMVTSFNSVTADCHDTDRGELCQAKSGTITVRMGVIIAACAEVGATAAQCNRLINNMARHEAGHVIGLGHEKNAGSNKLMQTAFPNGPGVPGADPWDNLLTFDSVETHALDCYRETSGTTPRC